MSSTFGKNLHISVFGGSHTEAIGVVIDGLPAGETIDQDALLRQMARRAPGRDKEQHPPQRERYSPHSVRTAGWGNHRCAFVPDY